MPETERLLLRRFTPADADAFAAFNADPDVMRFIGDGTPLTRAQSDELLTRIAAHWRSHGFGLWCVAERSAPERCLGFAGLAVPSFLPEVMPAVEVGWRVARDGWGRGLATEAARAALDEAFGPLGARVGDLDHRRGQRALGARGGQAGHAPRRRSPASGARAAADLRDFADDAASSPPPS